MIFGNVKWALDLAKYLIDDLFEIAAHLDRNLDGQSRESIASPDRASNTWLTLFV